MEFRDESEAEHRICSLDNLAVGETYAFDPPLHVAIVNITSKHRLGNPPSLRRPNFLQEDMRSYGVRKGTLISKSEWKGNDATGTFACESRFRNDTTGQAETVRYTAICKFSRRSAEGIRVEVRKLVQDTVSGEGQSDE